VAGTGSERGLEVIAYSGLHGQVKKNEIGGAYSMYEGQEKCIKVFGGKTQWNQTLTGVLISPYPELIILT